MLLCVLLFCFFQAEDGIRDLVRSRGLGDVYKRQGVVDGRRIFDGSAPGQVKRHEALASRYFC